MNGEREYVPKRANVEVTIRVQEGYGDNAIRCERSRMVAMEPDELGAAITATAEEVAREAVAQAGGLAEARNELARRQAHEAKREEPEA